MPAIQPATATNVTGIVAVANGGTGASTQAGARTGLGLVIGTDVLAPNGSGASLTALNATQITSGTIPSIARLGSGTADGTKFLRDDLTWQTPAGGGSSTDPLTTLTRWDDFDGGNDDNSGTMGTTGWGKFGGTHSPIDGEADHPGIVRISTSTTSGTVCSHYGNGASNKRSYLITGNFDATFVVRLNETGSIARVGFSDSPLSASSSEACYFEKLSADTTWRRNTRHGSAETRTDTSVATTTTWVKLRIRRIDASTIGFTIGAGSEQTNTTNLPTTALHLFIQLTNEAAAVRSLDIDLVKLSITGISR